MISHDASRTGAPLVLLHLARWLVENARVSPSFLLKEDGELADDFRALGPVWIWQGSSGGKGIGSRIIRRLGRTNIVKSIRETLLRARIRPLQFELVYSNTIANGEVLTFLRHPRVITHVHELGNTIRNLGERNLLQVSRHSSFFIAVSEGVKKAVMEAAGIEEARIRVIPPFVIPGMQQGINPEEMQRQLGIGKDTVVIGGSGNTDWRKGADLFVALAGKLSARYPGRKFLFVWVGQNGLGVEAFYQGLLYDIKLLGLEDRFRFTGMVTNPYDYYRLFDFFILSSREDPFPLVALENCLLEKVVVCFRGTGGIPEFLQEGEGIIVPYMDLDEAADRIGHCLADPGLATEMGRAAASRVKEVNDYDRICRQICDTIYVQSGFGD